MTKALLYLLIFGLTAAGGTQSKQDLENPRLNDIVLIKVTGERCTVAQVINSLTTCNPRLIGINYLYVGKNNNCDTLLRGAIARSKKVILMEGFEDNEHITSENEFKEVAMFSAVTGLAQSKDGTTDYYYRISDHGGKASYSFPFHVALQYDIKKAPQLASKSLEKDYRIKFYKKLGDFKVFTMADIQDNCHEIEGKIVLIGDLETTENIFKTRVTKNSSSQTFGTVIIANAILNILDDLDTRDVPIKRDAESLRKTEMKENQKR